MEDKRMGNNECEIERMSTISETVHEIMCQQDEINKIITEIEFKLSLTPKLPLDEPIDPMGLEGKTMLVLQQNIQIMNMLNNICNRL